MTSRVRLQYKKTLPMAVIRFNSVCTYYSKYFHSAGFQ